MLSKEIAQQVLGRCLVTGGDFAEIFEEVAEREKERVAVKCGEAVTTYEELNQLADFLGIQLRQMGIRRHDRVALILEPVSYTHLQ